MSAYADSDCCRVLVLLAACEGERNLGKQLQSILDQQAVQLSIVISVDPSVDATAEVVSALAASDQRVVMLPTKASSGGAGQNFFRLLRDVDFSGIDFVAFSDQDDIWFPDKLSRALRVLKEDGFDCYSSNVMAFWEDGRQKLVDKAQSQKEWDFLFESAGPGCTYVLRAAVVENFKKLLLSKPDVTSLIALHDWSIYAFSRTNGYRWFIDPRPSMKYRQHATNQFGVNFGWRARSVRARKIVDGWGISQARLIVRLIGVEDDPFVRPWKRPGRLGMLWLALNAFRARRKVADQLVFAAACLLIFVVGDRSDV